MRRGDGRPVLYVQVYARSGRRLFDMNNGGKVRQLLKGNQARVVQRVPFSIQLQYDPPGLDSDLPKGQIIWPDLSQGRPHKPIKLEIKI